MRRFTSVLLLCMLGCSNSPDSSLAPNIDAVCTGTPTHLSQIAVDHEFAGEYTIVVHHADRTANCDFSTEDGCDIQHSCSHDDFEVRNAVCGPQPDIGWHDLDPPWKVVFGHATTEPVQLAVFRSSKLLWQGVVELTFPGAKDCDFSAFGSTPAF